MTRGRHRVLHVGGTTTDAQTIRKALNESGGDPYDVEWVAALADGLERLSTNRMAAVLLDLDLPDCHGLEGLDRLLRAAPRTPILVVSASENGDDEAIARQVVDAGARDYLLTRRLDNYWLPRALHQAIDRNLSEEAFCAETERAEATLNSIGDAMIRVDTSGRITYLNVFAEAMTGWPRAEAAGRPTAEVLRIADGATREPIPHPINWGHPRNEEGNVAPNRILIRRDGSEITIEHSAHPIHDRLGVLTGTRIVFRDISAARATTLRMSHLASHDQLTDLPNRLLLNDRLGRALALAHRHHRCLAVLFLDIDHFKTINDSFGHTVGDEVLQAVARELSMCVRSSDTVSRHGGDEFVVVLSELERTENAAEGAKKIIAALSRPHKIAGHEFQVTVSIGISVFPDDAGDTDTLLKCADMALNQAKDQGKDGYRFFEPALKIRALERRTVEAGLRRAIARDEFELVYQPKVNLRTGALVGAEALIRWRHPERGLVEPAEFIPVAEDSGLIRPIGRWVIQEVCRQTREWRDSGLRPVPVSVNISGVEFRSQSFLRCIVSSLEETGLDARYLEIELTESVLMADVVATTSVLRELKELGVHLSIDDFGVGWSSLSHLRQFPIDTLKIDRSFVQEITASSAVSPLLSAVISMGRSLELKVIAEGVETREQLLFLQAENCGEGQGYYFSRPLDGSKFALGLENHHHPALSNVMTFPVHREQPDASSRRIMTGISGE